MTSKSMPLSEMLKTANEEVKELSSHRKKVASELKSSFNSVDTEKKKRAEANALVKEAKAKRDTIIKKLRKLKASYKAFSDDLKARSQKVASDRSKKKLVAQRDALNQKLQREALSLGKEDTLVAEIDRLESHLDELGGEDSVSTTSKDSVSTPSRTEIQTLESKARQLHKLVVDKALESETHHKQMQALVKQGRNLRKELAKVERSLNAKKKAANEVYAKYKASLMNRRKRPKKVQKKTFIVDVDVEKRKAKVRELGKVFYERFKNGERLNEDETLVLQAFLADPKKL